jgi:hypothetical protein
MLEQSDAGDAGRRLVPDVFLCQSVECRSGEPGQVGKRAGDVDGDVRCGHWKKGLLNRFALSECNNIFRMPLQITIFECHSREFMSKRV